jgi:hypothetical protein
MSDLRNDPASIVAKLLSHSVFRDQQLSHILLRKLTKKEESVSEVWAEVLRLVACRSEFVTTNAASGV